MHKTRCHDGLMASVSVMPATFTYEALVALVHVLLPSPMSDVRRDVVD